jgi:hypothetical protein
MLTGGLGSQLVEFEFVGGAESHLRELPQCRGVELDVGRAYWIAANKYQYVRRIPRPGGISILKRFGVQLNRRGVQVE